MRHFLSHLIKPYKQFSFVALSLVLGVVFYQVGEYFTDREVMIGNYGLLHTRIDMILSIILSVVFPIFITGIIYKGLLFGKKEILQADIGVGWGGGVLATIISGASCCGPTLAIYFGLIPIMTWLPYDGLELKGVAILLLLYATYGLYRDLETCSMPAGKKSAHKHSHHH